jgi:hypothetical protein
MLPSELTILCWNEPEESDVNLANLAGFLGLATRFLPVDSDSATPRHLEGAFPPAPVCLAASATTLGRIFCRPNSDHELKSFLLRRTKHFLIYAIDSGPACLAGLTYLTDGFLSSITPVVDFRNSYEISPRYRSISKQLTGLAVGPVNAETDLTFAPNGSMNESKQIIVIGDRPFFMAVKRVECSIFLVGCKTVVDVNAQVSPTTAIRSHFSQLIPVMMFLKHVFKDAAWHATAPYANFTIDDPLIQKRYGFLSYRGLLETMDKCGFSTSIAFIPWNYKRTDLATAELLRSRPDKFSVVLHGCDHTAGEFGAHDVAHLSQRINLAIERMEYHARVTGLPFAKVMVFPQGVFSTTAMKALKATNCVAAVNSTALPVSNMDIKVRLKDLLDVAVLNYEGFPLFVRRYPQTLSDCALDLFLEKPLLLVEHHGYFRRGYDEIARFVSSVNALDENLSWHGLGHVVNHTVLRKKSAGDGVCLKAYTHIAGDADVIAENPTNGSRFQYGPGERLRVFARRHLSEIRDNYLARNESLLSLAHGLKELFVTPARPTDVN